MPAWLANAIIGGTAAVFLANFAAVFVVPGWEPDPAIYGPCGVIIGAAFAATARRNGNRNGEGGRR